MTNIKKTVARKKGKKIDLTGLILSVAVLGIVTYLVLQYFKII